jgi:hypothetical protein
MIEFKFLDECQQCPEFEVTQDTDIYMICSGRKANHIISCEHIDRCRNIIEHLKMEVENNGNNR